jgi:hypothetical protein
MKESTVWAIFIVSVALIISFGMYLFHISELKHIENGYSKEMMIGSSYPVWSKCK